MSSYRSSYTPWKSSLPSSYKSGTSSTYSSRDDVSSTSRYSSSLASPTSYRPSFSGGTYRLKRDTTATSVPASPYVSRYTTSSSNLSSSSSKPDNSSTSDSLAMKSSSQLRRYGSTSSSLGKWSREPSPAALEHTNRIRSRDPSPVTRPLRGLSRDPSPSLDNKSKIGYSALSSYRMNVPKGPPPTSYTSRYSSSSTTSATRTPSATSLPDKSISYLTATDYRARTISRAKEEEERRSKEKEETTMEPKEEPRTTKLDVDKKDQSEDSDSTEESDTSDDDDENDDVKQQQQQTAEQFVAVSVCTRATSPTPPGTVRSLQNTTPNHIAITVERTILRSKIQRQMLEKEVQSERLDDATKYSRLALNSRLSPYNPRTERRSPSNLRYSTSPLSTTSKSHSVSTNDSKREDSTTSSASPGRSLNSPVMKSKLSPPRVEKLKSRQSSMESLSPLKPPLGLKADSPLKTMSTSPSSSSPSRTNLKLPNKDFRKSSLNVGPTERPRKSRTPSTGNDSDFNTVDALNGALQAIQRLERSPSACSEISNVSARSTRNRNVVESKLRSRCHSKPMGIGTPPSPLSRQNSGTNFRQKVGTTASPLAARSTKIAMTTAVSLSSGTESSTEVKKPLKKIVKKKAIKDVTHSNSTTTTTSNGTSTSLSSTSISETKNLGEKFSQPPVASTITPSSAVASLATGGKAKKSESSSTKKASALPRTEKDPLKRLKKLSSVSNFFVTQQKNTNSDDQIYLESSETSGGGGSGATSGSTNLDAGSTKSTKSLKKSSSLTRTNEPKTTTTKQSKTNGSPSASNCTSSANSTSESTSERPKRIAKTSSKSTVSVKSKTKSKSKSKSATASDTSSSYCPQNSSTLNESSRMPTDLESESMSPYGTSNTATTSNAGTDSEEPSWWQDTSQQIDTSSALDYSFKDEMRFKVRHNDSGEVGWWLRNDDDDTLADDVATLNQDDEEEVGADIFEEDADKHLEKAKAKREMDDNENSSDWWLADENESKPNEQNETSYLKDNLGDYKTKAYYEDSNGIATKQFPRSHLTPETDWWLDGDEEENNASEPQTKVTESPCRQNGTIQLKICRVESGEEPVWNQQNGEHPMDDMKRNVPMPMEQSSSTPITSDESTGSSPKKTWWLSGPSKKLFNIPRVESGEKAWWLDSPDEKANVRSKSRDSEGLSNGNSRSDQGEESTKLFNINRTASTEKAASHEMEGKRSKSRESEGPSSNSSKSVGKEGNKKANNIPRFGSREKAIWKEVENKRSSSRDAEGPSNDSSRSDREETNRHFFNIPRVWNEKDTKRSQSRDPGRSSNDNSRSDQEDRNKNLHNRSSVESKDQTKWFESSDDMDSKRSKSRETESVSKNDTNKYDQEHPKPVKLFNVPRLDVEEKPWWLEQGSDKDKKRSESKDSENWPSENNAAERWEPFSPSQSQDIWMDNDNEGNSEQNNRIQKSLQKQKEKWLEENNRRCKEQSENAYYQQLQQQEEQASAQGQWQDVNYRQYSRQSSAQHNTPDQNDRELQQLNYPRSTFSPPHRNDSQSELSNSFNFEYSERPPPLGQCASPVQHEVETSPPRDAQCPSPYENIPMTKVQQTTPTTTTTTTSPMATTPNQMPILANATSSAVNVNNNNADAFVYPQPQQQQQQQHQQQRQYQQHLHLNQQEQTQSPQLIAKQRSPPIQQQQYNNNDLRSKNTTKLFISRHQNIDELLSGSCPLFFDNESFSTAPTKRNSFIEEITPDQVRIHDSTAQVPIIQRMERDNWERNSPPQVATKSITPSRYEQRTIDDAAIQVYKDGDYGSYLDLESSLAEQSEEIEGLNTSRKNSLVVRTQLSVRVHAIIEKLLSAEGSDLRRALFSLKQVFQEDKDLVHAFVALGGLNCLVRVGNGADQNYQNYILRALGQVMLYVDGMNGVMKHEPTMQWLYSLIASNYRSVVKTALKLLLVFVEYAESNCHVLVSAIHTVDKQQGTLPWSNIMRLLKDYDNADAELVIYAASLINKTLEGLNDQDSFYDESDLLEQQGMESVIQHYMSKPGTDMDLINQLQLYEAVLKFEDGESDGTRLPDNTLRKTQRFRSSTDTAERRKSRRHSTGTSPGNIHKVLPTGNRLTPTQPALDEDSSSSTNSAEFTSGVFGEKNNRDGAGVTPGLRRRRERAERHRSFLKEQQEAAAAVAAAAANGYINTLEKREDQGQLVTAIPATVKNGDSPPESLTIIPECNGHAKVHHSNKSTPVHSHSNNSGGNSKIAFNNHSNSNVNVNANANANANATNKNALLINTSNNTNTSTNSTTNTNTTSNNLQTHLNLLSPTKQLLGTNTISIINNSFDKSNTNKLQQQNGNSPADFYNKKNLFMERNATVINGIMKNIQRNNSTGPAEHGDNNCDSNMMTYKKFENEANRLNTYFNHLNNSTPKIQTSMQSTQIAHYSPHPQSPMSPPATLNPPLHITSSSTPTTVASPKKTLNCTSSPSTAGFDFNPQTSTPIAPVITAPATKLTAIAYEEPLLANESYCATPLSTTSTTTTTPSSTSSGAYTPATPTSTLHTPTLQANYNTLSNTSVVPPPPPPPPPPPDLYGFSFMRPINYYNNNSNFNQNTTTTSAIGQATSTTTNQSNNTNNNLNTTHIASDAVDFLQINESDNEDKKRLLQLKRDHTVKDLTQKLSNLPSSPTHEDKLQNRIVGDMSGLISKAKEGLAKSKSKGEVSRASSVDQEIKKSEPKKSENELQWEELVRNMGRPLQLCDLDFTDLNSEDEKDILAPRGNGRGVPPPPPPMGGVALPPPVMPHHIVLPPPMMSQSNTSNGSFGYGNSSLTNSVNSSMNGSINGEMNSTNTIKKNKKTVKLFWKEVREDLIPVAVGKTIWDELPASNIDTQKLEHLFESRAKDLMTKKQQEMNKSKEVIVLDHKRSNAINIAMTKLPPPRAIKAAILKMDATVVTREGIDKLLNMLPTDEEKGKIQEAQMANPELPLGSAEQFLLTLASISELAARLRLWAFRLDFDNSEKEIAEPLMDLKHGIEILRNNRTFKCILSTLLSVGIFLNGNPVKGFQIEYLAKVPEVKDTVHKHSLLHHLCHIVMETCAETSDLYSEIGPITRASKADFTDLAHQLSQLEHECKASWDRLKLIAKHDCPPQLKQKLVDFLADCAERIIILQIVHRRVMNRYRKFLLWLGVPQHSVADSRPNEFCRILSEFALEYRTTRERVQQQIEKKANHRERNKTRGKLIVDISKFKTKEDKQDDELKVLLGTPSSDTADGTLTWRRRRAENLRSPIMRQSEENFTDGDDEILESLVKTATKAPGTRTTPRERKRTRHADRKSLRRTLKNGLTEEEKLQVAALIKTY